MALRAPGGPGSEGSMGRTVFDDEILEVLDAEGIVVPGFNAPEHAKGNANSPQTLQKIAAHADGSVVVDAGDFDGGTKKTRRLDSVDQWATDEDFDKKWLTPKDKTCWAGFRGAMIVSFAGVFMFLAFMLNWADEIALYSPEYFFACAIGGAIGGLPHMVVIPIDLMKCRTQTGEYRSLFEGAIMLSAEVAKAAAPWDKFHVLFRGWFPTFMGYTTQGAAKFGLYELFKYIFASLLSYEFVEAHLTLVFMCAAACAELIADCFLAPWEALKVRLQTSRQFPPIMRVIMPRVWAMEGLRGYFKGLPALWARQIPYTIVKFLTFEHSVRMLLRWYASSTQQPPPNTGPVFLLLTVTGGFIAGTLCATASHPADTVISKLNQRQDTRQGLLGTLTSLPCRELWNGLGLRIMMVGTLTALQWIGYDGFKFWVGLPTTGRGGHGAVVTPAAGGPLVHPDVTTQH